MFGWGQGNIESLIKKPYTLLGVPYFNTIVILLYRALCNFCFPLRQAVILCGPPGAGKSTWARQHAEGKTLQARPK